MLPEYGTTIYCETLDCFGKAVGIIGEWFCIDIGPGPYLTVKPEEIHNDNEGWVWSPN